VGLQVAGKKDSRRGKGRLTSPGRRGHGRKPAQLLVKRKKSKITRRDPLQAEREKKIRDTKGKKTMEEI